MARFGNSEAVTYVEDFLGSMSSAVRERYWLYDPVNRNSFTTESVTVSREKPTFNWKGFIGDQLKGEGPSWWSVLGSRLSDDWRASYNRYFKWEQDYGETQWNTGQGGEGFSDKAKTTGNCVNCAPSYKVDPTKKGLEATAKMAGMIYKKQSKIKEFLYGSMWSKIYSDPDSMAWIDGSTPPGFFKFNPLKDSSIIHFMNTGVIDTTNFKYPNDWFEE